MIHLYRIDKSRYDTKFYAAATHGHEDVGGLVPVDGEPMRWCFTHSHRCVGSDDGCADVADVVLVRTDTPLANMHQIAV